MDREAGGTICLQLFLAQRELARSLADGMRQRMSEIAGAEVDAVRIAHVCREIAGQLALEALEVTLELRAHLGPPVRLPRALPAEVVDPKGRRKPPAGAPPRPRRPRAFAGCIPPSAG
jgi:hypothetical protein